ncbi:MAG: oxidoreductase [Proteobacteria bacterium]|nr:oxidoreductase [Pseudomonadota bacterium]
MEFDDVVRARRSIRRFKPTPLSEETINELLEAARLAPSGSNIQPWRFIPVTSPEIKEKLKAATKYTFALKAPVLFVCCADMTAMDSRDKRVTELIQMGAFTDVEMDVSGSESYTSRVMDSAGVRAYLSFNVAIAVEHMVLKAVDLGLGSCWIGAFDGKKVKEVLGLDDNLYLVTLLPVGYPDQFPGPRSRIPLDSLVV